MPGQKTNLFADSMLISKIMKTPDYSVWWQLSDKEPKYTKYCEIMVKLICNVSMLKSDDYTLTGLSERVCERCDNFRYEDANYIILQCESISDIRCSPFEEITQLPNCVGERIMCECNDLLPTILGNFAPGVNVEDIICCSFGN